MVKNILKLELKSAELRGLGEIGFDARAAVEDTFEEMGRTALQTYRSSVPRRTEQLRGFIKLNSANRVLKTISVSGDLHDNSNTKEPIAGDLLADILEEGKHRSNSPRHRGRAYRRSKTARRTVAFDIPSTSMGSPTANWAENALNSLMQEFS